MSKHTSLAAYHFLPDPPNTMLNTTSCGVLEVTVRQGGWWWWMRKYERWCDSEVTMKKTLMKHSWALTTKGKAIWKRSTILGSTAEIQNQCVQKKPKQPQRGHRWCSGGDISARGCGCDNPDHKPAWASPPMQILTYWIIQRYLPSSSISHWCYLHWCVWPVKHHMDDVMSCLNPTIMPVVSLEVCKLMLRVKD